MNDEKRQPASDDGFNIPIDDFWSRPEPQMSDFDAIVRLVCGLLAADIHDELSCDVVVGTAIKMLDEIKKQMKKREGE